ncbi:MAG: hypothetical protein KF729_12680 [Sandaracinaceae bacterium]|nr:hypothetical protein [Sandaracinaceae bacterium]
MRSSLALALLAAGCSAEQPWEFRSGTGLPDEAPARLVAEVYEGAECGFACRPPGARVYCSTVAMGARGPAPSGLARGARYCFLGTAYDAAGRTIGVGCEVGTIGGDPITVTLAPSDEARANQCDADGGVPADAGPPPDGGVAPGPVELTILAGPGGGFLVQNVATGRGWNVASGIRFVLTTDPGTLYAIYPQVAAGHRFDRFEGGGCDVFIPCEIRVLASTTITLSFARL